MKAKNKIFDIYVVPHTHWDKEWYFTKQDSDILLFDNINKLLDMLDNNEIDTFTYDGQFSIIDDYLSYSQNNLERIKYFTQNKKLIVGPWYTQPDFFNITSESIVRNLLYGINGCKSIGAKHLNIAYVPDSFGHNNQMPQIYNQFGINNFIYWRGISKDMLDKNGIVNNWIGLNNNKVLSYNLLFGYWPFGANYPYQTINKSNISIQAKEFLKNTSSLLNEIKLKSKDATNKILLPLGGDQAPIMKYLKDFINEINKVSQDNWILSDYDTFFEKLNEDKTEFPIIEGELKFPFLSRIHKTIGSQRQDIKNLMKHLEVELYNNLEPLMSYWFLTTNQYDKYFIDKIIKNILTSQAHDSIGGCNSDRTNDDVMSRITQALDMVEALKTMILKNISLNLSLSNEEFIIYNSELFNINFNKKIKLFSKYKYIDIFDENNNKIEFAILEKKLHNEGMVVKPSINGEDVSQATGFYEYDIFITNLPFKAMEIKKLNIRENLSPSIENIAEAKNNFEIKLDGKFICINNLHTNKKIKLFLEAQVDAGDSYDYSPTNENKIINELISSAIYSKKYKHLEKTEVTLVYKVPTSENSLLETKQKFIFTFYNYENLSLELNLKTTNKSSEIRWRLIDQIEENKDFLINDQCYSVISRKHNPYLPKWKEQSWKEAPVNIESFESFVGFENNHFIYNNGINEYELIDNNKLALTLYRSVSVLGRNNLLWRPGRASGTSEFNISTNGSKLSYKKLEYDIKFDFQDNINYARESKKFITMPLYYQKQNLNNLYKRYDRFLLNEKYTKIKLDNNIIINSNDFVVKTFKKAEFSDDLIIRGYNPLDKEISLSILYKKNLIKFDLVNLKEEVIDSNKDSININKNQIVTILIKKGDISW
ncbi:glycoside hydrolase family 38 N-terminal domain-containing protein [Spiroplasma culicicola]|uniref:Alpha-mannosidase n=1 Tax=Spiroplasma culicicola AES-1 TaxID=1276246 RepID=W6A8G8_9MOLU|nr:glycosyl hydrolase-related protein [Spiroplasma culicicola]AHI53251.1 alpha-mannosidase [Spiroplasma culicicola AES-1]